MYKNTQNITFIDTVKDLERFVTLSETERLTIEEAAKRFPMRITPYYLSLIDWNDPKDPIRKMCIPPPYT